MDRYTAERIRKIINKYTPPTVEGRLALLNVAWGNSILLNQIDYSGSPYDFGSNLFARGSLYKDLDDGQNALAALLKTIHEEYAGEGDRNEINRLLFHLDHLNQTTPPYVRRHDVFLSYARSDRAEMETVRAVLRAEGLSVWADDELHVGTPDWAEAVAANVRMAGVIVVLCSPNAEHSRWVKEEWLLAQKLNMDVFPVLIAGHDFPFGLQLHQGIVTRGRRLEQVIRNQLSVELANCLRIETASSIRQKIEQEWQQHEQIVNEHLEQEKQKRAALTAEFEALQAKVSRLRDEYEKEQNSLDQLKAERENTQKTIDNILDEQETLRVEIVYMRFEVEKLREQRVRLERKIIDSRVRQQREDRERNAQTNQRWEIREQARHLISLGFDHFKAGNYELAVTNYTEAIRLNPNHAKAYNNRGLAYRKLGQLPQAIEDYTEAIRLQSDVASRYNNRGMVYIDLGKYELALADFRETIRLDSAYPNPYWGLGNIYYETNNYNKAITAYHEYERLNGVLEPFMVHRITEMEAALNN